jgi:SAM-dependent methyltransferase
VAVELEELRRHWDAFAQTDPLWAVLTSPEKRHGAWDVDEFFASGEEEISRVFARLDETCRRHGVSPQLGDALDFGCGVGRLTQALAGRCERVTGVDIAPHMVELAARYNRHGDRCRFTVLERDDLRMFPDASFDLVYTAHVLQHMEQRYAASYVREFLRVMRPGAVAVVELPTARVEGPGAALRSFSGRLEILDALGPVAAGSRFPVQIRVTNTSNESWPSTGVKGWYLVTVGNHWLDPHDQPVTWDDGRALLGEDLRPGESRTLQLSARAPEAPGEYQLEADLVQEGVAWFASKGCTPARVAVRVLPASTASRQDDGPPLEPRMDMFGSPQSVVRRWVGRAGGRVLADFDWDEISQNKSVDWHRCGYVILRNRGLGDRIRALLKN